MIYKTKTITKMKAEILLIQKRRIFLESDFIEPLFGNQILYIGIWLVEKSIQACYNDVHSIVGSIR